MPANEEDLLPVAFLGVSSEVLARTPKGHLVVWDLDSGKVVRRYNCLDDKFLGVAAVTGNGTWAFVVDLQETVHLLDLAHDTVSHSFEGKQGAYGVFSPNGKVALIHPELQPNANSILWNMERGCVQIAFDFNRNSDFLDAISHDSEFAVDDYYPPGHKEKPYLMLWHLTTGELVGRLEARKGGISFAVAEGSVRRAAFMPDERYILTGDTDAMLGSGRRRPDGLSGPRR